MVTTKDGFLIFYTSNKKVVKHKNILIALYGWSEHQETPRTFLLLPRFIILC